MISNVHIGFLRCLSFAKYSAIVVLNKGLKQFGDTNLEIRGFTDYCSSYKENSCI